MTNKTIIAGLVALAFVTGSIMTSTVVFADDDDRDHKKNPFKGIIKALNKISTAIEGQDSNRSIILTVGASDDTGTFRPYNSVFSYLFFGERLSCIDNIDLFSSSTTLLLEFGMDTIVEHENNLCMGTDKQILLTDGVDATFKSGDRIVLTTKEVHTLPWQEVFRQQSP